MRATQPPVYADEPWFDPDSGVCPVVATFLGAWNDDLPGDERGNILAPLTTAIVDSRNPALETWRAMLAGDWLVRTQAVAWLRLARANAAADALENRPALVDGDGAPAFLAPLKAANWAAIDVRDSVWATPADAATSDERAAHLGKGWEAPWAIAAEAWSNVGGEEARVATAAAALDAARAAVWAVAEPRVHAEVWNLAHGTTRIAAHAGFCLGGPRELRATREALQRSAAELVIAMVARR